MCLLAAMHVVYSYTIGTNATLVAYFMCRPVGDWMLNSSYTYASAKIIPLNEWGCRDGMYHAKNRENKEIPLAILSRILAQSCVTQVP